MTPAAGLLAELAVAARAEPLPEPTLDASAAVLLDWCGVAIGGNNTDPARRLRAALAGGSGPSRLAGVGGRAEPATAALLNGTAAHVLELDDIYSPGLYHPGAPTVSAALAIADRAGCCGLSLLRALAVGLEIGGRIAETLGAAHYRYWHSTGTVGTLSAAAAAAEILELDAGRFAHALALAATTAAGLQQTFRSDSMGKPLHSGHAAQAGVQAALAAAEGFTGTLDVLDGEIGMGVAMSDSPSWSRIGEPFGPVFLIERTTVKPYACCGHTFATIDAALQLHARAALAGGIAKVEVESYGTALAVAANPAPGTPFEAKFSIPFVVATALHTGRLPMSVFDDRGWEKAPVSELMAATTVREGAEFTAAFPAKRGGRVTVTDQAGKRHVATVPDRRGGPDNPLTTEQLAAKFTDLVTPVAGAEAAAALRAAIGDLRDLDDIRELPVPGHDGKWWH